MTEIPFDAIELLDLGFKLNTIKIHRSKHNNVYYTDIRATAEFIFREATVFLKYHKIGRNRPVLEITRAKLHLKDLEQKERTKLALELKDRIKWSISNHLLKEMLLLKEDFTDDE